MVDYFPMAMATRREEYKKHRTAVYLEMYLELV
jgi:hypothetical protein